MPSDLAMTKQSFWISLASSLLRWLEKWIALAG